MPFLTELSAGKWLWSAADPAPTARRPPEPEIGLPPFWSVAPKRLCALLHICPEPNPDFPVLCMVGTQGNIVVGRNYLARQARTLLRFAQSTKNPQLAAALIEKAADLKSQVDDQEPAPESSAVATDVERPS